MVSTHTPHRWVLGLLVVLFLLGHWCGRDGWRLLVKPYQRLLQTAPAANLTPTWDDYHHHWDRLARAALAWLFVALLGSYFLTQRRHLQPLTRRSAAFLFAQIFATSLLVPQLFGPAAEPTPLTNTGDFIMNWEADDTWMPLMIAYTRLQEHPFEPLYASVLQQAKFQYPPAALWIGDVLVWASPTTAFRGQYNLTGFAEALSWGALLLMAWYLYRILSVVLQPAAPAEQGARGLLALLGTLTFFPAIYSYGSGQIQTWLNAILTAAVWYWLRGRRGTAGVLVGCCALVKPQYAILLLWGALRCEWPFVRASAATWLVGTALAIWRFGWAYHVEYARLLGDIGRRGESYFPNQSVNGLLHRFWHTGDSLTFSFTQYAPFHQAVYVGTLATSALLLLSALWPLRRGRGQALDFALMLLAATLASPIAWTHHYGILLPLYALLLPVCARSPWRLGLLLLSVILTAQYGFFLRPLAALPGWNLLLSHIFFGALLALILGYATRAQAATTADSLRR
jgi:hypothetical protein